MIVSGFFWARKISDIKTKSDIIKTLFKVYLNYLMINIAW